MRAYAYKPWRESDFDLRRQQARRSAYRPLVAVAIAFVAGVVIDRVFSLGIGWWPVAAVTGAGWAICWRRGAPRAATCFLLASIASTAACWSHTQWRLFGVDEVGRYATAEPQPVCLEGYALGAPARRSAPATSAFRAIPQGEKTELAIWVTRLRHGARWRPSSGRVKLVVDGHLLGARPGDRLRVFGQLRGGGEPMNPGQFDFAAEDRSDRRLAQLRCESPDCVGLTRAEGGWSPRRLVAETRLAIEGTLWRRLGPQRAPLAAAMLVGARQGLSRDRTEPFRRTGTLHVLVVSGLHVGIVVGVFYAMARFGWFPRRSTFLVVMVLILGYAVLTGARPPVVRAAVLAEMICLAALTGRGVLAINSLAAAVLIVLAWNPSELFRSGSQLSFIAAATLIWWGARQLDRQRRDPMTRLLNAARPGHVRFAHFVATSAGAILMATLAVWITTAPLLLTRFHLLSPVALPVSLAVFPLVGVTLLSGLALVAAEVIFPPAAAPLAWCCGVLIDGLQAAVDAADAAPIGSLWLAGPSVWWTLGTYGLLTTGLVASGRPGTNRWLVRLGLAWVVVGFSAAAATSHRPPALRCSFIAVGHGCSVLIESPDGATVLYDAGSLGEPRAATETISGVLLDKGIHQIDALVLSHADVDHFNAVPGLLERFSVGGVYFSRAMFPIEPMPGDYSAPAELVRELRARRVPWYELAQGDRLICGELSTEVLHPVCADAGRSDNANSLVLAVEYGGRRVLLPGDLETTGLDDLLFQSPYDCDVLLAPHHGSTRSDPPGFAAWSSPEWVVISGGNAADSASAGETYAAAGARVLRTPESGMVEFTLRNDGVSARTYLPRRASAGD